MSENRPLTDAEVRYVSNLGEKLLARVTLTIGWPDCTEEILIYDKKEKPDINSPQVSTFKWKENPGWSKLFGENAKGRSETTKTNPQT